MNVESLYTNTDNVETVNAPLYGWKLQIIIVFRDDIFHPPSDTHKNPKMFHKRFAGLALKLREEFGDEWTDIQTVLLNYRFLSGEVASMFDMSILPSIQL